MPTVFPELDSSLFKIDMPTRRPYQGALLVAEPFLREEPFNHAVISLIDYAEGDSSMGLVLNKPTGYTIGDVIDDIDSSIDAPIHSGGPVASDRLFYIHNLAIPGAHSLPDGLSIGGDFNAVKDYLNSGAPHKGVIRFFVGYSGWEPLQLDEEIENHVWAVASKLDATELLQAESPSFWYSIVKTMGTPYRNWLYHPTHPNLN